MPTSQTLIKQWIFIARSRDHTISCDHSITARHLSKIMKMLSLLYRLLMVSTNLVRPVLDIIFDIPWAPSPFYDYTYWCVYLRSRKTRYQHDLICEKIRKKLNNYLTCFENLVEPDSRLIIFQSCWIKRIHYHMLHRCFILVNYDILTCKLVI